MGTDVITGANRFDDLDNTPTQYEDSAGTGMTHFTRQGIIPTESVKGLLARIDELTLETRGKFWNANGEELPW